MLSDKLTAYAAERFDERAEQLASVRAIVDDALAGCADADEATLLRYLYATMPVTDCLDVAPDVLLGYVRHALRLRREMPWTAELGEGMFVHYVLTPRVNNEAIFDCRPTFFEALRGRVEGLSMYEAVREVNYWCCEMATYQTSDDRTLGPLGVLASGSGRCGEESTFLVTALRSVGIPARQIYTPWWAHCDDNHAWVEAFTEDGWHYLGACEPEEELDRGWFTNAAGRALMEETRLFSDYRDESCHEQEAGSAGCMTILNVTDSYAISAPFGIRVTRDGAPVTGATATVEVLNMADWPAAATLLTNAEGACELKIGLGSVRVSASAEGLVASVDVNTAEVHEVELALEEPCVRFAATGTWRDFDVAAPADNPAPSKAQTPEQSERARSRKAASDELRRERVGGFERAAAELAASWPGSEHAFACAFANAPEVATFLGTDGEPDRLELLGTLTDKDFRDVRASVLESHLISARSVREAAEARLVAQGLSEQQAHDAYVRYVLCPRTYFEELTAYRQPIQAFFGEDELTRYAEDPRALWAWLGERLSFDGRRGLARPMGAPDSVLASGIGSANSRAHAFVAVCRTAGVAARVNPETCHAEFMEGGRFVPVQEQEAPETLTLHLTCADASNAPTYYTTWTIARLEPYVAPNCEQALGFRALDLEGIQFVNGALDLALEGGLYRLTTTTRLPSGNQQASELFFELRGEPCGAVSRTEDGAYALELHVREPNLADMLNPIVLPAFGVADEAGAVASPAVGTSGKGILAFLDEGMEPTEHLLNELRERADDVRAAGLSVTVVMRGASGLSDPTLTRTLAALPEVEVRYDDFSELPERLARRTYANPELLPLTLLLSDEGEGLTSLYATAGYNVGTVDLLLRLSALAR